MKDFYIKTVTQEEKQVGFKLTKIENPSSHYAFQPNTLDAVVLTLELDKERIIKIRQLSGRVGYSHQKFDQRKQKWRPIGHTIATLKKIKNILKDKHSKK